MLVDPGDVERGAHRSGGDHQRVVVQRCPGVGDHGSRVHVDGQDAGHAHGDVAVTPHDAAHRVGHVVGGESRRGHLVEQRLEGVEVVGVDEGDVDGRSTKAPEHREASESCADDHNTMARRRTGGRWRGHRLSSALLARRRTQPWCRRYRSLVGGRPPNQ